jgi:hypothetical protein
MTTKKKKKKKKWSSPAAPGPMTLKFWERSRPLRRTELARQLREIRRVLVDGRRMLLGTFSL